MSAPSLTGRVALLLGTATVLILGGAAILMDHLVDAEMQRRFDAGLVNQARTLAALAESGRHGVDVDEIRGLPSRLLSGENRAGYAIACADGSLLQSHPAPARTPPDWGQTAGSAPGFADLDAGGVDLRAVWFRFQPALAEQGNVAMPGGGAGAARDCRLLVVQSREELDQILVAIDGILLVTPMLALLAVLALSPLLVRRGLKPLATLGENMRGIGPRASGERLPSTGTRELEPLVVRFNEVLARMDEGVTRERQFAGALAHETRTRLAELRSLIEVERRYPSARALDDLLAEIGSIGGELETTVSGLLLLTRLDAGIERTERRAVDLDDMIAKQLDRLDTTLGQRGLRVDVRRSAGQATLVADPALLDIVVGNLLGNACQYAPRGDVIRLDRRDHSLVVGNRAPDLAADEVARFGQRFWSKHHGSDGHAGLGLALAGTAAAAMDLRLEFALDADRRLSAILHWRPAED